MSFSACCKALVPVFSLFVAGYLAISPAALAADARVTFSGMVPCRVSEHDCGEDKRERVVFSAEAGIDYAVLNTDTREQIMRPVVRSSGGATTALVHPSAQHVKPGAAARFFVVVPIQAGRSRQIEICATGSNGGVSACRRYSVTAFK